MPTTISLYYRMIDLTKDLFQNIIGSLVFFIHDGIYSAQSFRKVVNAIGEHHQ